jgi:DNA-binding transcriptional MerR regulator
MYRAHEFASLAGVTVKALHHYDRLGLLKPQRTASGYRIYTERDLERLEQIIALKFLGLPLKQVRILLDRDALQLPEALRMQRAVLEEKRRLLDRAIGAIESAEKVIHSGKPASAAVLKQIIEAIEMQTNQFMKNYYREEAWVRFSARHVDWPSRAWTELFGAIQSALSELSDAPASPKAQALARRWRELRVSDSGGDPKVHTGLLRAWNDRKYWPEVIQNRFSGFNLKEISGFMTRAFGAYRKKHFGDFVWEAELQQFTPEDRERMPLATADLYFKIEKTLDQDPAGEAGQALAARWMELLES